MKFPDGASRRILLREFFADKESDPYGIKKYKDIENIVDIGANVGLFSLQARFIHPSARVIALEPNNNTFLLLEDNVSNLKIETYRVMLGDDGKGVFSKGRRAVAYVYKNDENGDVDSLSFLSIIEKFNVDLSKTFFKIDCEGGERGIVKNKDCLEALSKSLGFGIEIHLDWDEWKVFFDSIKDSHDVEMRRRCSTVNVRRKVQ